MSNVLMFAVEYKMTENCIICGVAMVMTADMERDLRRSHRTFYCINGHSQYYSGKSDVELLRDQLAEKERMLRAERERAGNNYAARVIAETEARNLKRRISGGVCPCCKRTFQQVSRHMRAKHPDFVEAQAAK